MVGAGAPAEVVELTLLAREAGALEAEVVPVLAPVDAPGLEPVVDVVVVGWATTAFFTPTLPAMGFTPALLEAVDDGCRAGFIREEEGGVLPSMRQRPKFWKTDIEQKKRLLFGRFRSWGTVKYLPIPL